MFARRSFSAFTNICRSCKRIHHKIASIHAAASRDIFMWPLNWPPVCWALFSYNGHLRLRGGSTAEKTTHPKTVELDPQSHLGEKTASFKANNQGQWVGWKINWCGSCVVVSYNISLLSCPAPPWSSCPPSQDPAAIWSPNSPLTNPVVTQLVRVMKMHEESFKQWTDLNSRIYSNSTTLLLV